MPAVLDAKPAPASAGSKYDDAVRNTLDDTARKVRATDALTGGLVVAAGVLLYAVAAVLLDRAFDLPAWSRQLGLLGLIAAAGFGTWSLVVRPYRRQVNPRYIARQVEGTIADAKNAVINWVDLHDRDGVPGSVKTALSAKAAAGLAESDPTEAVASTRVAWAGGVVAFLVGVLAVLFLLYKSQFLSLLGRAFNPFSDKAIAARTDIELIAPTGDLTVTDGVQIGFTVRVTGKIPVLGSENQVRVKVRYTPDAAEFDEYPLEQGDTIRDYSFTAGRSVVQNGFWYRIAAGDAETPEYRVTVRARPMIQTWRAEYEYPEYLRLKPDVGLPNEPKLDGFRGTKVTLTVKTNRTVKSGTMTTDTRGPDGIAQETPITGEVVGANRDSLQFKLTLQDKGTYTISFTSVEGEVSGPTVPYPIEVYADAAPTVAILKPEQEEIVLPTTGLLAVDTLIGDDHGIAAAALKFRIANGPAIAAKPFRDGKSFKRDADNSYPTSLDYKDSVKLSELRTVDGKPLELKPDTVLEYWVEATDNCTVPAANVGKSKVQRVKLTAPEMEPMKRQEQEKQQQQQQDQRQQQQDQNNQQQDQKNQTEQRDAQQPQNRDRGDGKQEGQPQEQPKDPNQKPDPMNGGQGQGQGGNDPSKPPEKPEDRDTQRKAEDLQRKIDEQNKQAGEGRGDPNQRENAMPEEKPGQGKPGDMNQAGQQGASEGKQEPQPNPMNPNDPNANPNEGKGAGDVKQPNKAEGKQEPKPGEDPNGGGQGGNDTKQPDPKQAPQAGDGAGTQKQGDQPQPGQPEKPPLKPGEKPRDTDGGGGKGSGEPQADPMQPQQKPGEKEGPKEAGKGKGAGDVNRAEQKKPEPGAQQQGNPNEQPGTNPQEEPGKQGGTGRDSKPPKAGEGKPKAGGPPDAAQGKEPPKEDPNGTEAGDGKGAGTDDPKAQPQKGEQKAGQGGKPDPAKQKEIADAMKDLRSDDKAKQDAARDKLDRMVGKDARQKAEDIAKDMKSGDPQRQKDAQQKLDQMAKEAGEKGPQGGEAGKPEKLTPEQKEKLADAAKDLNNPDQAKREAAEKKVDDMIGKGQREQLQKQMKDFEKDVKDLGSDDAKTRDAAKDRLDKTVGKDVREKAEKAVADQKSMDQAKRDAAEKAKQDLAKQQAGQKANDPNAKPKELTEQEKKELAEAAKDLLGKDEAKRKEAEKKIDEKFGKDAREQLEKDLKDVQGGEPSKAAAAKERLEQMAKEGKQQEEREWKPGGNARGPDGKPMDDNPENRLKSAELQLENFKKLKDNPDLLKKAGYSKEEYEKFLKGYEEMVNRQRGEVEAAKVDPTRKPGTDPRRNVSDGTGANERLVGPTAQPGGPGAGGASVAPPGFGDAHKRFAEEALKGKK